MSIVGTRPPTLDEWNKYELHHRARLAIKPGITGMWQVSGRSEITDFEEVVKLDTEYISEWNVGMDREKKVPDKFTAMVEVYDYRTRVKTKQISLIKWLNDLRQSNCKYYIGKNDFKPVLAWMMEKIKR